MCPGQDWHRAVGLPKGGNTTAIYVESLWPDLDQLCLGSKVSMEGN